MPLSTHDIARDAIALFLEYRDVHGYSEADARTAAVREIVEGVEAAIPETVEQSARRLGVSPVYVRRMAARGRLAALRIGDTWAIEAGATIAASACKRGYQGKAGEIPPKPRVHD